MIQVFYFGFIIGFLYNFCAFSSIFVTIQFILKHGIKSGFIAGMGHATAQFIWIVVAINALSLGSNILKTEIIHYKFIAAIILFILGVRLLFSSHFSIQSNVEDKLSSNIKGFLTVFIIAISAPGRIIGYSALLLLIGAPLITMDITIKTLLILSILTGIVLWWFIFSIIVSKTGAKITSNQIRWLQRITAFLLIGIAALFMFIPSLNII